MLTQKNRHYGMCHNHVVMLCHVIVMLTVVVLPAVSIGTVAPEDLLVGEITVETYNIYSKSEIEASVSGLCLLRRVMNKLHVDTKEFIVRRELLFQTGDPYRPRLLAETARNLRQLGFLNRIEVTAVDTLADGSVPVLVRVRDTWSLTTSAAWSRSSSGVDLWSLFFAEDNFLGYGLMVGLRLGADEDATYGRVEFATRRAFGSRWSVGGHFSRRSDGDSANLRLMRPFLAADDPLAFLFEVGRFNGERRYYVSNAPSAATDNDWWNTLGGSSRVQSTWGLVPLLNKEAVAQALWRVSPVGGQRIWRLGATCEVKDTDYNPDSVWVEMEPAGWLAPGFPVDDDASARREQGTQIRVLLSTETLGRTWVQTRFLRRYGPVEDLNLQPWVRVDAGVNFYSDGLYSGRAALRMKGEFYDGSRFAGGLAVVSGSIEVQPGARDLRYCRADLYTRWVSHRGVGIDGWLTSVSFEGGYGVALAGEDAFRLGLRRGLRTLSWDDRAGDRLVRWNVEEGRVLQEEFIGLFNLGAAVFYNGGLAWFADEDRDFDDLRHEVGVGLRLGPSRAARTETLHIDVSRDAAGGDPVFTVVTSGRF